MKNALLVIGVIIIAVLGYLGGTYVKVSLYGAENVTATLQEMHESTAEYEIDAKYPQFGAPAFDAAIKNAVDEQIAEIKNTAAPAPSGSGYKNSLETDFRDSYFDDQYISVKLLLSQYTGGAHPMTIVSG